MARVTDRAKLISISLLIMLSMSIFVGIVSEDANAAEAAEGYPHLEAEYTVNPESISSIDDEVVVTLRIKGIGGKVEDLPPDILENMPRKPLDVVLVLDRSGSMESTDYPPDRITAAKEAAKIFVNQIKEDDRVAVVSFSSSTSTVVSITSDKGSAKKKINRITTGGGTAIGEGIITALSVLEGSREEAVKAIVLLSDGAHNTGISPITVANRAKDRGIPIYTVGIGTVGGGIDPLDENTLKEIASITGGEYLYAPDESVLKAVYEILSTKVLNVAGLDVRVNAEPTVFFNVLKSEPRSLVFDVIPPDTEKMVQITGKLTVKATAKRIPIFQRFIISYTDLITGERKPIIKGPVYVVFTGEIEPSDVEIEDITFRGKDNSYINAVSADGTRKDATVYHLSDDITAKVEIKNSEEVTVESQALIYEEKTGKGSTDTHQTSKDSITHTLDHGGVIGKDIFSDTLFYPGDTQTDKERRTVFVVFDKDNDVDDKWSSGSGMYSPNLGKAVSLHPRSKDVLALAAPWGSGSRSKFEAFEKVLRKTYKHIDYSADEGQCDWEEDFTILDLNGKNPKRGGRGNPTGLCVDYSAAYISLLRSLEIPCLKVGFTSRQDGHSFTEAYINEKWRHADPTWNNIDEPDIYLIRSFSNLECKKESAPGGGYRSDKLTTLKYAVGMTSPHPYVDRWQLTIDLNDEKSKELAIEFKNLAKSTKWWIFGSEKYIAEDFDIRVVDSGVLETEIAGLSGDEILDINEVDHAYLTVKVPDDFAGTIKKGSLVDVSIKLKVDYETIDGEEVEKDYVIIVRVSK